MIKKITLLFSVLFIGGQIYSQTASTGTYTGKPIFEVVTKRNNAVLGIFKMELFPNIAPKHVRNFDSLVSVKFFDTTAFHRVIPGFVIQGGDPNSRSGPKSTWGYGDPNQPTVNAEFSAAKHLRGILSAARDANINSANSQFFICVAAAASLNGQYSVYGRVTSGMNWVDTIVNAPRDANDCPNQKIEMFITYLGSNDTVPVPPVLTTPANGATQIDTASQLILKWNKAIDGQIYHFDMSLDSTFTTINYSYNTGNLLYVTSGFLLPNKKYFWRVNTNNGGHTSVFSPVRYFTTKGYNVGLKEKEFAVTTINVYPNPSNGKFTFSELKAGSKIELFDASGKLIYETLAKTVSPSLDLEGSKPGIYIYRISSEGREIAQGKLVIK